MRIAVIQFPGSNCERETMLALKRAGLTPIPFLWNESPEALRTMDGYVIVGGFSYEDRSRAGVIAALNPIMQTIKEQSAHRKPVLGICNGAQILVETGMIPGFDGFPVRAALTHNKRVQEGHVLGTGFYNAWCHLTRPKRMRSNAFTRHLSDEACLRIPVAHSEGRFILPPATLSQIQEAGLIALQYCNSEGEIINEFPVNPNGSLCNIAALCNPQGNVMAIMPHPERCIEGDALFISMREYIEEGCKAHPVSLQACDASPAIRPYRSPANTYKLHVALIIHDNQAFTVENTLRRLGIPLKVTRRTHWEIQCESKSILHQIQASGLLFNEQKEYLTTPPKNANQRSLLIKAQDDCLGLQKTQQLQRHFSLKGWLAIQHGVLWHFQTDSEPLDSALQRVIHSNLLYNPFSHECYEYD